jgi:hypothetical protein
VGRKWPHMRKETMCYLREKYGRQRVWRSLVYLVHLSNVNRTSQAEKGAGLQEMKKPG